MLDYLCRPDVLLRSKKEDLRSGRGINGKSGSKGRKGYEIWGHEPVYEKILEARICKKINSLLESPGRTQVGQHLDFHSVKLISDF